MKSLLCSTLLLLASAAPALSAPPALLADKPFPCDGFQLTIALGEPTITTANPTGWDKFRAVIHLSRTGPQDKLESSFALENMFLQAQNLRDNQRLAMRGIHGLHRMGLSEDELKALTEATEAAAKKEEHLATIKPRDPKTSLTTEIGSSEEDGKWRVWIKLGQYGPKYIPLPEALELQEQLKQAKLALPWYEKLLSAEEPPELPKGFKPPVGNIQRFAGGIGLIDKESWRYGARFELGQNEVSPVIHRMEMFENRPKDMENQSPLVQWNWGYGVPSYARIVADGPWVGGMAAKVVDGVEAAQEQDGYSFIGRRDDSRYEITADPSERTAELKIHPLFGASNLYSLRVDIDQATAKEMATIVKRAEAMEAWIENHLELLVTPNEDGLLR